MRKEHAQQAKEGAKKVMTVASANGRYNKESTESQLRGSARG